MKVVVIGAGPAGLAAAVGVVTLDRPPGRKRDLVAHSTVLDALAGTGPVVPDRLLLGRRAALASVPHARPPPVPPGLPQGDHARDQGPCCDARLDRERGMVREPCTVLTGALNA